MDGVYGSEHRDIILINAFEHDEQWMKDYLSDDGKNK
jgi:hypothetical protein